MIELLWNAPVSEVKMGSIIDSLDLYSNMHVLDVGCGCGEVLIRVCEHYGTRGVGLDSSAEHIEEARRRADGSEAASRLQFIEANAERYEIEPASLNLVMCLGASHAFGLGSQAIERALQQMAAATLPGGQLLLADGYLKQPKPAEYIHFIGESLPDELTHASIVQCGKQLGLIPLGAWTSSHDEWDDFEWRYQRIIERKAAENPTDQNAQSKRDTRREWLDGYLNWGRNTLGYGTYLFKKPSSLNS